MLEHPIATFFLSFLVSQLGPNLAAEFVYDIGRKRANSLFDRTHFTNQLLADALARSFDRAASSISLGLTWRYFRLEFMEEKIVREFANRLERIYLYPFYTEYNAEFDEDIKHEFRRNGKKYCDSLSSNRDTILQIENIVNSSVQKLLLPLQIEQNADTTAIENLALQARISIIDAIRSVDDIDERFCDFLEFNNLLVDAISYFFLDIVTSEQKVQWTLQHFSVQELQIQVSRLSGQLDDDGTKQISKLIEILELLSPISNDIVQAFGILRALTESSFELVLSEIKGTRQGVDEISTQIAGMERRLMNAVKRRDHTEVAEVSAELAYLKDRQQKTEAAEKSANAGLDAYTKGMAALESGSQEQASIHFSEAEDHFRKAVEVIPHTDQRKTDYLTSLGNSMTMQGKVEDAIPTYERAINLSPDYAHASKELIKRLSEFGDKQHNSRQFEAAIATFKYALLLDGENEQTRGKLALSLNNHANTLWAASSSERHTRDRCRMMMLEAVFHSPMVEKYHKNLRVMQGVPSPRPGIVFGLENFQGSARAANATDAQHSQPFFDVLLNTSFPDSLKYWI